jgi:hypothetical protein
MKRFGVFSVAGLMALSLLAGCGGGGGSNDDEGRTAQELLPGTWRVTRIEAGGQDTACPGEINFTEDGEENTVSCGATDTVTFYENGTFTGFNVEGGAYAGTWQLNGDIMAVNFTAPEPSTQTINERVRFTDDNSMSTATEEDGTAYFVRQ